MNASNLTPVGDLYPSTRNYPDPEVARFTALATRLGEPIIHS